MGLKSMKYVMFNCIICCLILYYHDSGNLFNDNSRSHPRKLVKFHHFGKTIYTTLFMPCIFSILHVVWFIPYIHLSSKSLSDYIPHQYYITYTISIP